MAEGTRLKDLQADIKKMLEMMDSRYQEYSQHRAADLARMDRLESHLSSVQMGSPSAGSHSHNVVPSSPAPFQVRNIKLDFELCMFWGRAIEGVCSLSHIYGILIQWSFS